jgi:hypothetical protein
MAARFQCSPSSSANVHRIGRTRLERGTHRLQRFLTRLSGEQRPGSDCDPRHPIGELALMRGASRNKPRCRFSSAYLASGCPVEPWL